MPDNRWIELKAVRGNAVLVDSKRIFTFASQKAPSGYKAGEYRYWIVIYAILTDDEERVCMLDMDNCPYRLGYRDKQQSQTATVSRAYIHTLKTHFDQDMPTFLGVHTEFFEDEPQWKAMIAHTLRYQDWIESCVTRSTS